MDGDNIGHALRGFADRIINLDEEKDAINKDRGAVFAEAKEAGFNIGTLREIVREMRMDSDARNSRYQLLNEYRLAVGILADTPLGEAALEREQREAAAAPEYPTHRWAEKPKPTPFAEQPVHTPRPRGRPRKDAAAGNGSRPMFDA